MKIISFNSYKGGACRTTTCYNVLPYLVEKLGATSKNPILVFDVDLDSMGLTNLFINGKSDKFTSESGFAAQDLFVKDRTASSGEIFFEIDRNGFQKGDGSVRDNGWFFDKSFMKVGKDIGFPDDPGCVLFCGADADASTINKVGENPPLLKILRRLRQMNENAPRAVVFDCAAGIQLTTRAIIKKADVFVMCMRPTLQFRIGTADYLLDKIPAEIKKADDNRNREIILVPTAVASVKVAEGDKLNDEAEIGLNSLQLGVKRSIKRTIIGPANEKTEAFLRYNLNTDMIIGDNIGDDIGLPEIERFKWEECLLYSIKEPWTKAEKELQARYELLAGQIVNAKENKE